MRFYELHESFKAPSELQHHILKRCQPWLNLVGGLQKYYTRPLWRGVNAEVNSQNPYIEVKNRSDRKPLTTPLDLHILTDDWFYNKSGIRYRSNSFFTVGDRSTAEDYGVPCIFMPIGPVNFAWSPRIADLYNLVTEFSDPDLRDQKILQGLDNANYQFNEKLEQGIRSGNEVMVYADSAYLIDYSFFNRTVQ